jgi:hypothetical protein
MYISNLRDRLHFGNPNLLQIPNYIGSIRIVNKVIDQKTKICFNLYVQLLKKD